MKVKVAFKNVKHSQAVEEKINHFSEKFGRFLPKGESKWHCSSSEGTYFVEVHVICDDHHYHAKASHENFFKCFDLVTDKMQRQLEKQKGKFRKNFHSKHHELPEFYPDYEAAWEEFEYEKELNKKVG